VVENTVGCACVLGVRGSGPAKRLGDCILHRMGSKVLQLGDGGNCITMGIYSTLIVHIGERGPCAL
jgi:hypothetical protein